jgi:hypothetical protein
MHPSAFHIAEILPFVFLIQKSSLFVFILFTSLSLCVNYHYIHTHKVSLMSVV